MEADGGGTVSRTNQLTAEDDLLYHVGPDTIADDYSPSKDPRFYDRYWNVWHDDTGDLMLAVGGSFYPLLGRAESYAIVNLRGDHRSVRAFRKVGRDHADLTNGPLRPRIVEGLRRWHHVLEPGDWGFSYDLTVTDTHQQEYSAAWGPEVPEGERHVTAGFEGFTRVEGWVQVGDERIEWGPGVAHGTRDRHWGVGRGVGGPPLNGGRVTRGGWKGGIWIDLGDVGLWGKKVLWPLDDPHPRALWVKDIQRRLRFDEDTQVFTEGLVDLTFNDGSTRHLHLERLGPQTTYMRCGLLRRHPGGEPLPRGVRRPAARGVGPLRRHRSEGADVAAWLGRAPLPGHGGVERDHRDPATPGAGRVRGVRGRKARVVFLVTARPGRVHRV